MTTKSAITTHVLDISVGRPAGGIPCCLEVYEPRGKWVPLGSARTNSNGRVEKLTRGPLKPGTHRLRFETKGYFRSQGVSSFYPFVEIVFEIVNPDEHYHVPLLLSPFGYSTYRGS